MSMKFDPNFLHAMRYEVVIKFGKDVQDAVPAADIAASGSQTQWNDAISALNVFDGSQT